MQLQTIIKKTFYLSYMTGRSYQSRGELCRKAGVHPGDLFHVQRGCVIT